MLCIISCELSNVTFALCQRTDDSVVISTVRCKRVHVPRRVFLEFSFHQSTISGIQKTLRRQRGDFAVLRSCHRTSEQMNIGMYDVHVYEPTAREISSRLVASSMLSLATCWTVVVASGYGAVSSSLTTGNSSEIGKEEEGRIGTGTNGAEHENPGCACRVATEVIYRKAIIALPTCRIFPATAVGRVIGWIPRVRAAAS